MRSESVRSFESGGLEPEAHCVVELICISISPPNFCFGVAGFAGAGARVNEAPSAEVELGVGAASASVPGWKGVGLGVAGAAVGADTVNFHPEPSLPTVRLTSCSPFESGSWWRRICHLRLAHLRQRRNVDVVHRQAHVCGIHRRLELNADRRLGLAHRAIRRRRFFGDLRREIEVSGACSSVVSETNSIFKLLAGCLIRAVGGPGTRAAQQIAVPVRKTEKSPQCEYTSTRQKYVFRPRNNKTFPPREDRAFPCLSDSAAEPCCLPASLRQADQIECARVRRIPIKRHVSGSRLR